MGQNGVFVFGRADFGPWALCFDTPNQENAIEKPQTKFDRENFQYHSKSSFAGKSWFMHVENSHAIIIQEPQVNCVICKLETAEVLFYMHDLKNKNKKSRSSTDDRNNVHYHAHHPPSNFTRLVLFLFFFPPSASYPAQPGERTLGPGQCDRCPGPVPPHPGHGPFLLFLHVLFWL